MDHKLNIKSIEASWFHNYKYCVRINNWFGLDMDQKRYICDVLTVWFGSCKYYWGDLYLCGSK